MEERDGVDKAATAAAAAAGKAARAVEQAAAPIEGLEAVVRDARRLRDAVAHQWELALEALKRGARAAADEGVPEMYDTLFPAARVAGKKNTEAEEKTDPEQQAPPVTATQTAA